MMLYKESVANQTDHFTDAFVCKNGAYHYGDVMTFENLQLTPFCLDKFSVRKWIFECLRSVFSANLVGIR